MLRIHHARHTRSVRVIWLLEELGLDYEICPVDFPNRDSPEHRALHPLGLVPVFEDGDIRMIESGAMVEYVLERYGDGRLAPPASDAKARATYLQWFHYGEATLADDIGGIVRNRYGRESERVPAALDAARRRFAASLRVVDDALAKGPYVCGDEFTAADIVLSYAITRAKIIRELPPALERVPAYLARLRERPAYAKAWE